jgi:hypothetical protein
MKSWYGWFIEQSFDDQSIFQMFQTVKMKSEKENWKEHIVQVPGDKLDLALDWLTKHIKSSWYAHLIKGNEIIIIYKDKYFKLKQTESFKEADDYGRLQGIIEEQLPDDDLFKLARDTGF